MAYTTATIVQEDPPGPDGRVRLVVEFTGAGENTERREVYLDGNTTLASLKAWGRDMGARLSARKTIADQVAVGNTLDLTPPAGPTQAEADAAVWFADKARLRALRQAAADGITGMTAVADALATSLQNRYAALGAGAKTAYTDAF